MSPRKKGTLPGRAYRVAGAGSRGNARNRSTLDPVRVAWVAGLLGIWALLVIGKLVDLQILDRPEALARARRQQEHTVTIEARRGRILDRTGQSLAESIEVPSLYAHPKALTNPASAARALAPILSMTESRLERMLSSGRNFVWLGRRVSPAVARQVHALNLVGVEEVTESRRYYPGGRLAAQVLGFVGADGIGLGGIEYRYDAAIKGRAGKALSVRDGRGNDLLLYLEQPYSSGEDLRLSIDQVIQYHAEVELDRAMEETGSTWGTVVIMDPRSGAVLAMATRPSFNPNNYQAARTAHRRNRPVTDPFEPGSTLKIFIAAAALDRGLTTPDEWIDCGHGSIIVSGKRIRDHKVFDLLQFKDVIAKSSNVGTILVGSRLEPDVLHDTLTSFGFGSKTEVGLPGESVGILHPPKRWSGVSQASMSIGQEISVTALQLVRAVSAVANGGMLPQAYIVEDGSARPARRVIKKSTAETLNRILEWTVQDGTAKLASVPGYQVAGKTGTAQKPDPKGGYGDDHVASFLGYAPSQRPVLAMIVVLDTPQGRYHGGEVAAPVFARIATPVLRHLGIPPDKGTLVVRGAPRTQSAVVSLESPLAPVVRNAVAEAVVPDVRGNSLPAALAVLARAGLEAEIRGTGRVVAQAPEPGLPIEESVPVQLRLARYQPNEPARRASKR